MSLNALIKRTHSKEEFYMAEIFTGNNPSQMYMDALFTLCLEGDVVRPRGKAVKEIRPVILEFTEPANRLTFLLGRVVNPFFQLAESTAWIMGGRSDVKWLLDYNASMEQFSDDGVFFNAPYGERLRHWNKSDANSFIMNPFDQLYDVYEKLKADPDTRQAVAVIYNPIFDHARNETKDRPCNLLLTFKIRKGKLDLTVMNRSNDLHWGTFGANLCQFATVLESMASWLEIPMGTYNQITDSLHIYLEDYGAKETDKVLGAYGLTSTTLVGRDVPQVQQFTFHNEPRMSSNFDEFHDILEHFFEEIDPLFSLPGTYVNGNWSDVLDNIHSIEDSYLRMSFFAMFAYRAHKRGSWNVMVDALDSMPNCSWKLSCLRFLYPKYKDLLDFQALYEGWDYDKVLYIERTNG
ncbi:hypothetical protein SHANETTE_160 [Bacillus phage Shanette]|uniref:Thymidylate synthase n=2 Tax=Siminovitchvirus TaxID=1918721 RepID=S5MMA6_9CAUD|nr:thymidylate synthase [Bacillus phage JL]YP_009216155.1 thymidylate synthase [Bacillus phage Shanette]AGR46830.1 thymidylate synthase [Bacillus phage JL]AGR47054.1 hypothetical protein SHANETTE_160 [Bacillus phage Shanette]